MKSEAEKYDNLIYLVGEFMAEKNWNKNEWIGPNEVISEMKQTVKDLQKKSNKLIDIL